MYVRPSGVHTAPVAPQAGEGDSVTVTAPCEEGCTRTRQWSSRSSLRRSLVTEPPVTPSSARMCLFEPFATAALKLSSSQNSVCPSCSAGTDTNAAVSGGGPATVVVIAFESARPSAVHSAPVSAQLAAAANSTVTAPCPLGSTVTSHRSLRPSTRRALLAVPPVTDSASSRRRW